MWSRHEYPKHEVFTLNLKEDCERKLRVWMCVCLACVRFETQHHKEVREWKKRSMGTSHVVEQPSSPLLALGPLQTQLWLVRRFSNAPQRGPSEPRS